VRLVFEGVGRAPELRIVPPLLVSLVALVDPTLRAVKEQRYQRERPWFVDHSKFARTFPVQVTPHRDAIRLTLDWYAAAASEPT
jgi:hypothetical protein